METFRALSITPTRSDPTTPIMYELNGDSTEIGSADDNAIVLADPSVAPHHLEVRRQDERDRLLVNLAERRRNHDLVWVKYRKGDTYWCPRHGSIARLDPRDWCSKCRTRRGSLWLMRPLTAGDTFEIGLGFRAEYITQARAPRKIERETPPRELGAKPRRIAFASNPPEIPKRALPTDDSNFWCWRPNGAPFPIFMHQRVNVHTTRHARENREREVGGVLLGQVCRDDANKNFLIITHALPAEFAEESRGQLTFTHNTWLKIHRTLETQHPDKTIVGWYHTHPGWSIFLSEWDLFIHQNFFKHPWQVALVIDPALDRAGFFVWDKNKVSNPNAPVEPFRLAELDGWNNGVRPRVRIKLKEANN